MEEGGNKEDISNYSGGVLSTSNGSSNTIVYGDNSVGSERDGGGNKNKAINVDSVDNYIAFTYSGGGIFLPNSMRDMIGKYDNSVSSEGQKGGSEICTVNVDFFDSVDSVNDNFKGSDSNTDRNSYINGRKENVKNKANN